MQASSSSSSSGASKMVMQQWLLAFAVAVLWSSEVSAQANFQFYKLSLIWPDSYCMTLQPHQNCFNPIPRFFTIHGLWPTFQNDTPVPRYDLYTNRCFNNPRTQGQAMGALSAATVQALNAKWPTLLMPGYNPGFWQYEWRQHGMCSDYGAAPSNYFTIALNLANNNSHDPLTGCGYPISPGPGAQNPKTK
ncbi:hypothetical protein V6N13_092338 [Hibiscus sabdariffa]